MLRDALEQVLRGEPLSRRQAHAALSSIMQGECVPERVAALLAALRTRGETYEEIAGMAGAMRAHSVKVRTPEGSVIDTCGTGGDGANTINISTGAAFVAAAGGAIVAKHGNRSISSKCGSADVLEALGVPIDLDVPAVEHCLEQTGIGFLFAPAHHPAMKHVMPVRRAMGVRTVFNLLGPLTNPAGARRQVIGVFSPNYGQVLAEALGELGSEHVLVVCGEDGRGGVLDEVSTCGPTRLWELKDGRVSEQRIEPGELGLATSEVEALKGGDASQNAAALESVFAGEPGPRGDAVAANAGAALYVAGLADTLRDGVASAQELLRAGSPADTLDRLRHAAAASRAEA
ncbi:MAG: anthranilate phosphoribosyltransferase [Myxococcota bacterium]|nr:anthranilate phosphoribosyltransferase [Myxococcota bacterium]